MMTFFGNTRTLHAHFIVGTLGARSSTQSGTNTPIDRSYTSNGVYIALAWRRMREESNGEEEGSGREIEEEWTKEDGDQERNSFKSNLDFVVASINLLQVQVKFNRQREAVQTEGPQRKTLW